MARIRLPVPVQVDLSLVLNHRDSPGCSRGTAELLDVTSFAETSSRVSDEIGGTGTHLSLSRR